MTKFRAMKHVVPWTMLLVVLSVACSSSDEIDPSTTSGGGGGAGGTGGGEPACVPHEATTETVQAANDHGTLEGTLEIPLGCGEVPVVVLVSGSGSQDRDGDNPASPNPIGLLRVLSQTIRDQTGAATLRYDDPGIGGSVSAIPANVEDFLFEDEVDSAAAFVAAMRQDGRFELVIVAGHSMGSLIGILVDQTHPLDGFVSLAGAGRRVSELLREQLADQLTSEQYQQLEEALTAMENGELAGPVDPPLDQIIPPVFQPYFVSWIAHDPAEEFAKSTIPSLIIQGLTDIQVTEADAQLLAAARPDATLVLVPDMAHTLKQATDSPADQNAAYTDPNVPFAPGLMPPLVTFVDQLAPRR